MSSLKTSRFLEIQGDRKTAAAACRPSSKARRSWRALSDGAEATAADERAGMIRRERRLRLSRVNENRPNDRDEPTWCGD